MAEITIRIAKRIMLARLNTIKKTIENKYDEYSDSQTQSIWDDILELKSTLDKVDYNNEETITDEGD